VASLDTLPRTVQNPAQLPPKPEHPSLIRTNLHLLAWIQKKTEQSLRLCTTWGLCWTSSCENSYSQHIRSSKSSLTHSFPDIWHPSGYGLEVPHGFQIFWLFHWFCVCSDSASSSIWNSAYQTPTHQWNFQFHHLTGTRLANLFSYWGIPEFDFLHHSVGPELHDCTRIPLAHPLQSLDWLGIGQHLFRQPSQHESKSSPSVKTLPSLAPLPKLPDPVPDILKYSPPVEARKPLRLTLINAAAYSRTSKLEGSNCFQLWISLLEFMGHSTTTSETKVDMSTIPEDYHNFTDIFSKSKASKLADYRPYDLKTTLDEGTSLPYGPINSLSQEELATLHKFIDENLATGLIHPSHSPHGAPVLFIQEKDSSLWLCVDFWGLNQISKKDRYPLPLISDLLDAPWKARVYTRSISGMHTTLYRFHLETNGRLHSKPTMVHSSGW